MATNRELKAEQTREKLYESALTLINEKGYENVSVEDITKAAGVAKGTFYTHFDSKENLLYYTYIHLNTCYTKALAKAEKKDVFFDVFDTFVFESYKEIAKLGKNVLQALGTNMFTKESRDAFLDKDRGLYTSLRYLIGKGIEEGLIDQSQKPEDLIDNFAAMVIGVESFWSLSDTTEDLPSFAHRCFGTMLAGFIRKNH